ncbi:hypothetical protein GGF32_002367 [Allomyces javanicus]|nr:hypothetical protein GGF32_002367 [Allomyces javanicus]
MQALLDRADLAIPVSLPARHHHDPLPHAHPLTGATRIPVSSYGHLAGASAAMLAPPSDDRSPSPTTAHSAGVLAQFALTMAAAAAASSSASMSPPPIYSVGPTASMPLACGGSGSLSSSLSTLSSGSVPDGSHPSFLAGLTPLAHPRMPAVAGNGLSGKRAIPKDAEDRPVAKRLRSSRRAGSQGMDGHDDDGEDGTDPDDEGDDHDHDEPEHDDEGDGEDAAEPPPAQPRKQPTAGRRKRVRSSERRFICQHCQQSFKRSEHLKRHLRVHTGERPFACLVPGCAKTFSRTDNLAQHMKIHAKHAAAHTAVSQAAAAMAAAAAAVPPHHHHHHHLPPALAVAVPVHMSHAAAAAAAHAQYAHAANAYAAAPTPAYMTMAPPHAHHHHAHAMRAPAGYPSAAAAYAPRATHYAAMAAAVPHYPGAAAGYTHAPMPPSAHGQQQPGHSPTGAAGMVISWVPVLSSAARPVTSASLPPRSGAPISATPPPSGDDLGAAAGTPPPSHAYPGTTGANAARGYDDAHGGAYGLVPPTPRTEDAPTSASPPYPQTGSVQQSGATATTPPFPMLIPYSAGHDLAGYAGADYGAAGHAGYAMAAAPWGPYQAFSKPSTSPAHSAASARGATAPLPTRVAAVPTTASKAQTAGSRRASSPAVAVAVTADSRAPAPPPAGGELDSSQYLTLDDPE